MTQFFKSSTFALILTTLCFASFAQTTRESIIVDAIGRVVIEDIQGRIIASVVSDSESPEQAIADNNQKITSVINALRGVGINEENIQTSQFSLYPIYKFNQGERTLTGYGVNNGINITMNNSVNIGPLLELMIDAGINRIDSVDFTAIDQDLLNRQALRKAIAEAKTKASVLATAAGVKLGKVIRIDTVNSFNDSRRVFGASATGPANSPSSILPGTNYYSNKVVVEYLID